ncbi:MAG: response regulator [Elusimicrobia bacterium]|nr:response regulator [Elusimicrobiota bacterium]
MQHKILIVDDEDNVRFVIKEAFSKTYQVFLASEGLSALEIIKKERPTLVFLDMKMPGISGLEVLSLIKETGLTPIIWMLTGEEDLDIALKTLKLGASGYLTKPFDIKQIRNILLNAIQGAEQKEQHDTQGDKPWQVIRKKP